MQLRLALVAGLLAFAGTVHATTMVPLDLAALARRADRVLIGRVETVESHFTADHDAIYTEVTIRVERAYKGAAQPGETVVVRREGGTVGKLGMHVYGAPRFQPNEEVVVFLERRGSATWVVGMAQGKMTVVKEADRRVVLRPDLTGIKLTRPDLYATASRALPLEDFEVELRRIIAAQPDVRR
jgi:hypothetical protein